MVAATTIYTLGVRWDRLSTRGVGHGIPVHEFIALEHSCGASNRRQGNTTVEAVLNDYNRGRILPRKIGKQIEKGHALERESVISFEGAAEPGAVGTPRVKIHRQGTGHFRI